jgi:two-component system chemotaxis response regulator CheY
MANLILSVDDSATMRRMVGRVVATLGFELLEASDGLEALELLARHGPDVALVVLDVNMPRMDGEEALQAIKADPRLAGIPVMMLTTESERSRVLGFIQKGAANYLMKPFTPEDLSTKIAGCLGDLF